MHILHLIHRVGRASFGLGPVAMHLAKGQRAAGAKAAIWCLDTKSEVSWAAQSAGLPEDAFRTFAVLGPSYLGYSPMMERSITEHACRRSTIIHQHGIWTALSRATSRSRRMCGSPTVVAPHGSLDEWALRKSWWKKRLALKAYEWDNLTGAACLHALSASEASSFRAFGLTNPIAVIPNGISSEWLGSSGDAASFRRRFDIAEDQRVMLFLSRITPKKGLPMFLQALARLRQCLDGWVFAIAGVDEFDHLAEVKADVGRLKLETHVRFVGPLYDQDKRDAFAAAELFILPSYSEGAPMVILEALGAGVPVLTTQASPWESLITHGCGWWTAITNDGLAEALEDALSRSPVVLQQMGARGRSLMEAEYTWSKVAADTLRLYQWLLHRADRPEFVITD